MATDDTRLAEIRDLAKNGFGYPSDVLFLLAIIDAKDSEIERLRKELTDYRDAACSEADALDEAQTELIRVQDNLDLYDILLDSFFHVAPIVEGKRIVPTKGGFDIFDKISRHCYRDGKTGITKARERYGHIEDDK